MTKRNTRRSSPRRVSREVKSAALAARRRSTRVVAAQADALASAGDDGRNIFRQIAAANAAWLRLGATVAAAAPHLARGSTAARNAYALWEAATALSVRSTAAVLGAQRAAMAPFWASMREQRARLGS